MSQMDFNPEEILATDVPQIVNTNEPHMACLFLVDTSGSMISGVDENGNKVVPIKELNDALNRFKDEVCKDEKTKDILDRLAFVQPYEHTIEIQTPKVRMTMVFSL